MTVKSVCFFASARLEAESFGAVESASAQGGATFEALSLSLGSSARVSATDEPRSAYELLKKDTDRVSGSAALATLRDTVLACVAALARAQRPFTTGAQTTRAVRDT